MTKDYSAKHVRVLEEVEHIRLNPSMYIGSTDNPTHLIEEALDNALDEALAGYAKIIAVKIDTKTKRCSVMDSGRGIPISEDTPITISSKLFSGAKFQDKKSAYEISSGLHGVGLVAVNALSAYYKVEIYRNNKHAVYDFKDMKLKTSKITKHTGEKPYSTKIEFLADKKFFNTLEPDIDRIRKRMTTASAEMEDDIRFILMVDDSKEVFNLSLGDYFRQNCLTEDGTFEVFNFKASKEPESFHALFTYEDKGAITPKVSSSINLLPVDGGGTHVLSFFEMLRDFFTIKAKKMGYKFQPNDALMGLRSYLMLKIVNPQFSGQTKEKLTNRKSDFDKYMKVFKSELESWANKNEESLINLLERFQDYRSKLDSKRLKSNGTAGKRASTKFTKLRDCTSRLGELFIVEGDSAGGSIIQSRDPKIHAILPLKGKSIPNVTVKKNILENIQVGELIRAIGVGIGSECDITKIRYDKIICATDADADGSHIACLLSMVMAMLQPEVVKAGKYYIARTPLFAINEKKKFVPLWTDAELEKARKENRTIQRYKGLGEMNPWQLKISLLDVPTRNLVPVTYPENIESLIKLFSSADEKRKLVNE